MTSISKDLTINELVSILEVVDLDPKGIQILDKVVHHYLDIVGEGSNVKVTFLATISRKLPKNLRIHITNHSRSGAGKTWTSRKVLKPFWHDVIEITKFTDAWLNSSVDDLEGKVLLWQQVNRYDEQGKGTTGQLKILLTDEGISYGRMEQVNNRWVSRIRQSNALPVVITTTITQMNEEDARRFFLLSADESDEQTQRIIAHNLSKAGSIKLQDQIQNGYEDLKYLVKFYEMLAVNVKDVLIPYANRIQEILPNNFHMRTDINKLIQLIKIIAFIHVLNRKVIFKKGSPEHQSVDNIWKQEKYILADINDLYEAYGIVRNIFTQTNYRIPDGSIRLLEVIKKLTPCQQIVSENDLPTIKDCIAEMNVPRATLYSYLNPLKDYGFVDSIKVQGSKESHLRITGKGVESFNVKQIEFTALDVMTWFNFEFNQDAYVISEVTNAISIDT